MLCGNKVTIEIVGKKMTAMQWKIHTITDEVLERTIEFIGERMEIGGRG